MFRAVLITGALSLAEQLPYGNSSFKLLRLNWPQKSLAIVLQVVGLSVHR